MSRVARFVSGAILALAALLAREPRALACGSSADCSGATPICDALFHTCRACNGFLDCTLLLDAPLCVSDGILAGRCVACVSALDCSGAKPVCDVSTGACVAGVGVGGLLDGGVSGLLDGAVGGLLDGGLGIGLGASGDAGAGAGDGTGDDASAGEGASSGDDGAGDVDAGSGALDGGGEGGALDDFSDGVGLVGGCACDVRGRGESAPVADAIVAALVVAALAVARRHRARREAGE